MELHTILYKRTPSEKTAGAYMRVHNAGFDFEHAVKNIKNLPCTPLYDFCNAFPSLLHAWLFMVLEAY